MPMCPPQPTSSNKPSTTRSTSSVLIPLQAIRHQAGKTWREHYGVTTLAAEVHGKRLELLKEVSPRISRVALLCSQWHQEQQSWVREV